MAKRNVLSFSLDDTAKYGIPGIVRVGRYQMGHLVFVAAELNRFLQECEADLRKNLDRINASNVFTEEGKRIERRSIGTEFLGRVDKITGAHLASMDRTAGEMKADRTIKAKPVDSATEKWIWTQVANARLNESNPTIGDAQRTLLDQAVSTNDQMVYEAIMNMPEMFHEIGEDALARAKGEWDQKNLAGASQEEKDIREAHDALEQSAKRLKQMIENECGLNVSDGDPLDKYEEEAASHG